jgi:hypothetical protein
VKVLVYVEGESDRLALADLLAPLIAVKAQQGISIEFHSSAQGDAKKTIVLTMPERAVDILRNDPHAMVALLPDLYPRNKGFPHETPDALYRGMVERFEAALHRRGVDAGLLRPRFHAFCLKHDLEALLLAAEESMASMLGTTCLARTWRVPVEDQNQDVPPKRVVRDLFQRHGRSYRETLDAAEILAAADYRLIAERCPQCFAPFVAFLEGLSPE